MPIEFTRPQTPEEAAAQAAFEDRHTGKIVAAFLIVAIGLIAGVGWLLATGAGKLYYAVAGTGDDQTSISTTSNDGFDVCARIQSDEDIAKSARDLSGDYSGYEKKMAELSDEADDNNC